MDEPFVLGVNYWPRRKAMYWWRNFEADEVREEFSVIRDLGLGLVRIFLLWDDWQPRPDVVDPIALDNLGAVCDAAAERELQLDVTFFTGHMSGPSWAPRWLLHPDEPRPPGVRQVVSRGRVVDSGYANPYTHPLVLEASQLLLRTVVERYREHPAIGMWNLGNEPALFAQPPNAAVGRSWAAWMADIIRELDPDHPVTCGLHVADLVENTGLRVNDIFEVTDRAVMHGYPMYADWAQGPLDPDFVPYLCALTSALCGKPTLMEEFGGCTAPPGQGSTVWHWMSYGEPREQFMASEEALAQYLEAVLPRLVEVGATGALIWCYADYVPALYDRPPCEESIHERHFGLVRPDGSLKPHAEVLRRFAASAPRVESAKRSVTLDVSPEVYYEEPLAHAIRLYETFLEGA
jgi:endo-1,4-beta-mannosidase